jgi:hypothetical protein
MINFELSNGHPYGPHVPTMLNDNQFVEYQLEDLAGFPSSAEEEERVSKIDELTLSKYYLIKKNEKNWIQEFY